MNKKLAQTILNEVRRLYLFDDDVKVIQKRLKTLSEFIQLLVDSL